MSKKQSILNHLKSGKSITKYKAFNDFLVTNLGDVIFQLRNSNFNIQTEMKRNKSTNSTYAIYKLIK